MEFYSIGGGSRLIGRLFQFPTGWNSTNIPDLHKLATLRFNSQLDGILLCLPICGGLILFAFQFPTGWNSTVYWLRTALIRRLFQFPTGWNSTEVRWEFHPSKWVSIPNGMEFYNIDKADFPSHDLVSIPNGMEFYSVYLCRCCRSWLFQFPTGWNST